MMKHASALALFAGLAAFVAVAPSMAEQLDVVKVAIPQRGSWETSPADLGREKGIFAKHGIMTETLYTAGGGETMQALISGSIDVAAATGTAAVLATFAKGAPVRPIASSITGAQNPFWYVPMDSPLRSLKEAAGKTIAFSATGSSSHLATLALVRQSGADLRAIAAGTSEATYTQVMSGQIDIGWAAAPFGIAQIEQKRIRIIAKYNDIPEYRDMTARMHVANLEFLTKRPDVAKRFLAAYDETLDWMFGGDEPLEVFGKLYALPVSETRITRDQLYSRHALDLRRLGLDYAIVEALSLKFIARPFTPDETGELLKYFIK